MKPSYKKIASEKKRKHKKELSSSHRRTKKTLYIFVQRSTVRKKEAASRAFLGPKEGKKSKERG